MSNGTDSAPASSVSRATPSMRRTFPVLATATFIGLMGMGIIIPLIPKYMEQMNLTGVWIGIIFATYSGTRILMAPFIGRISDKKGRRPLLILGLFLNILASLGYVWATNPGQLVLVRFLHGTAGGMIYPIAMSYLGDVSEEGKEGQWMGYFNAIVFSSFCFAPLIAGVITSYFNMQATFITMSVLSLIAFILVVLMLPESQPKQHREKTHASYKTIVANGKIRAIFSYRFAVETGWAIWSGFIAILAGISFGIRTDLIGVLLLANALCYSLMMIPFGKMADRVSKNKMIIVSGLVTCGLIALTPFARGFWPLLVLGVISAFIGAAEFPPASALAIEEGRRYGMASTISIINMATSAGMVIGPLLGGVVMDSISVPATFYVAGIIILVGTLFYIVQIKVLKKNGTPIEGDKDTKTFA